MSPDTLARNDLFLKHEMQSLQARPPGLTFPFFLSEVTDLGGVGRVTRSKSFPPQNLLLAGTGSPGKDML